MADADQATDVRELGFEEALGRLENLIDRVESGEASLEASLKDYAAGMALVRRCRDVLDTAEARMLELVRGPDGAARLEEVAG